MGFKGKLSKLYRRCEMVFVKSKVQWTKSKVIAIIGCGRSGTTFSSKILKDLGIIIGHERLLKNGISSWYLISDQKDVPLGPTFRQINNLHPIYIHQVREPLAAISSVLSLGNPSWKFLAKEIPLDIINDSPALKAMKYYYYWNIKAEKFTSYRVRSEFFLKDIMPILQAHKIETCSQNTIISKNDKINTRQHSQLTWDDLRNEDVNLYESIRMLGKKYGYPQ
jgi:hypothetical protein